MNFSVFCLFCIQMLVVLVFGNVVFAADTTSNKNSSTMNNLVTSIQTALNLYNQRNYAAAADAFERIIQSAKPDVRLYYYAALAEMGNNKQLRAAQLFKYIIANFPNTTEATCSQKALGTKSAATSNKSHTGRPFAAADIARDGANGIDQSRYPNCWFEASMSALAQLPRGQQLLADTIRYGKDDGYIVRFRNDGVEYIVSPQDIEESGIHDRAAWASIIECAQIQKFPGNIGSSGADDDQSRLEVGLGCITGCKAEVIYPSQCDISELSSFIGSAIKSQNPIVAGTFGSSTLAELPHILVPQHAYTITGFDPSKNMVTVRNPHGSHSKVFGLDNDPQHFDFQQLDDGVVKMSLSTFQKYFYSAARSFI